MSDLNQKYGNNQQKDPRKQENYNVTIAEIKNNLAKILDEKQDPEGALLVDNADKLGRYLNNQNISTSQIRNVFFEIKNIDFDKGGPYKLNIARAKLAYIAGKHQNVKDLKEVLDEAIKKVSGDRTKFNRFLDFFEAIVAYHRSYRQKED